MKLIATPNPNAKKILIDQNKEDIAKSLEELESILSVFIGPDFITVTKEDNFEWEVITEDIVSIFDKL